MPEKARAVPQVAGVPYKYIAPEHAVHLEISVDTAGVRGWSFIVGSRACWRGKEARIRYREEAVESALERKTMRQIYLRLLPFCFILYFICYPRAN